jgi:hypothetical protein
MSNPWLRHVVVRVAWSARADGRNMYVERRDLPFGEDRRFVPVAAFADRGAAEAFMREQELEAARVFNPFQVLGPLSTLTSLSPAEFTRRLDTVAGPLPEAQFAAEDRLKHWRPWWDEHQPQWSDTTLAVVWELFDAVRFYDILELDVE